MRKRGVRKMIKFMDEIVEAVEEFARAGVGYMVSIFGVLAKWTIVIAAPAWILPYKVIRGVLERWANYSYAKEVAKMGESVMEGFKAGFESVEKPKCESQECDSCPIPPCQKGAGGHD